MTESPILIRYVSEIAYRCCLTLSLFSRPHSSECAINEHRALIDLIAKGPADKAADLMAEHLEAVAARALLSGDRSRSRDLVNILQPYAKG